MERLLINYPVSNTNDVKWLNEEIEKAFCVVCDKISKKTFEELDYEVKVVIDLVRKRNVICKEND